MKLYSILEYHQQMLQKLKRREYVFAPSLMQCIIAVTGHIDWKVSWGELTFRSIKQKKPKKVWLYKISPRNRVYHPTIKQVHDVELTGEVWRLKPTKLYKVGRVVLKKGMPKLEV